MVALACWMNAGAAWADEPDGAQLQELRQKSLETRRELQTSVFSSGIASIAIGVALSIPDDYDQGLRFAGLNTLGFGVVNTIVGGVALAGIAEEAEWEASQAPQTEDDRRRYADRALADESREAWGHGINLGLAGAYAAVGGMALAVSQLNVDHPNRWLGSGIAILTQAAHLATVDMVGSLMARDYERRMRALSPDVGYDPNTASTFVGASYRSQF